jgi:hypothetical protein
VFVLEGEGWVRVRAIYKNYHNPDFDPIKDLHQVVQNSA